MLYDPSSWRRFRGLPKRSGVIWDGNRRFHAAGGKPQVLNPVVVAVGTDFSVINPAFMGSHDGVTWSVVTPNPSLNFNPTGIANFNGNFVAVGHDSNFVGPTISTSPDGAVWTPETPAGTAVLLTVGASPTLIVAAGGFLSIQTSPNMMTWTSQTPARNWDPKGIAWNGTVFVIVGTDDANHTRADTSPDGVTWTARTVVPSSTSLLGVCWSATLSLFIAVGTRVAHTTITTSPDGATWTQRTEPPSFTGVLTTCAANNTVAVVAGNNTGNVPTIATSVDGATWTVQTPSPATSFVPTAMTWSPSLGLFVLVGVNDPNAGNPVISTSPDGINWTQRLPAAGFFLTGVAARS